MAESELRRSSCGTLTRQFEFGRLSGTGRLTGEIGPSALLDEREKGCRM
jgi:hypothetical protein